MNTLSWISSVVAEIFSLARLCLDSAIYLLLFQFTREVKHRKCCREMRLLIALQYVVVVAAIPPSLFFFPAAIKCS